MYRHVVAMRAVIQREAVQPLGGARQHRRLQLIAYGVDRFDRQDGIKRPAQQRLRVDVG